MLITDTRKIFPLTNRYKANFVNLYQSIESIRCHHYKPTFVTTGLFQPRSTVFNWYQTIPRGIKSFHPPISTLGKNGHTIPDPSSHRQPRNQFKDQTERKLLLLTSLISLVSVWRDLKPQSTLIPNRILMKFTLVLSSDSQRHPSHSRPSNPTFSRSISASSSLVFC